MAEPASTRIRLIEAAIRLFAEQGVEGVSLRAAAEAAGARNTGAVHYHFKDREGLLAACIEHIVSAMRTPPPAGLPSLGDPLADLLRDAFWSLVMLDRIEPGWGAAAQTLLGRIVMGDGAGLSARFEALTEADAGAIAAQVRAIAPEADPAGLRARIDLAALLVIAGVAARGANGREMAGGDDDVAALLRFCAAGLRGR